MVLSMVIQRKSRRRHFGTHAAGLFGRDRKAFSSILGVALIVIAYFVKVFGNLFCRIFVKSSWPRSRSAALLFGAAGSGEVVPLSSDGGNAGAVASWHLVANFRFWRYRGLQIDNKQRC